VHEEGHLLLRLPWRGIRPQHEVESSPPRIRARRRTSARRIRRALAGARAFAQAPAPGAEGDVSTIHPATGSVIGGDDRRSTPA
jgi:hypothetical protein